jgi:hypothetical protein
MRFTGRPMNRAYRFHHGRQVGGDTFFGSPGIGSSASFTGCDGTIDWMEPLKSLSSPGAPAPGGVEMPLDVGRERQVKTWVGVSQH